MKPTPKKSVTTLLLTGLIMVAALVGCSSNADDSPDLEETTDAASARQTEYIPASEDGPAQNVPEPNFPVAANENSLEGAQAALEYFWQGVDYGRLTGETRHAGRVSSEDCDLCSDLVTGWSKVYEDDSWAALHGEMQLEVTEINVSRLDEVDQDFAEISFSMTEPPADFYENGELLEEESFGNESTAEWWAQMVFDATAQQWEIEWVGLESQLNEGEK